MGRKKYLTDTNVAIDYIGEVLPEKVLSSLDNIFDSTFYISVINKIELLGFSDITKKEELKFQELINAANVLELDEVVVKKTIEIRKHYKIKLPDAIIAATSMVYELTLISRNISDFKNIDGLHLISPMDLPDNS